MSDRAVLIGSLNTGTLDLILTSYKLTAPEVKSKYISVPCRDGDWDFTTALTDGQPRYNNRQLTANFEIVSGNYTERETLINNIMNQLDGLQKVIVLPDNDNYYLVGRCHVEKDYNNLAHGALIISAVCEPWRYAVSETIRNYAAGTANTVTITIGSRRAVVPVLTITGGPITITFGATSVSLSAGSYQLANILLVPGTNNLTYSGTGTLTVKYREAIL